jgi:hypothetical protein
LFGIALEILPTDPAVPPSAILKQHVPTAMSRGKRRCSVSP